MMGVRDFSPTSNHNSRTPLTPPPSAQGRTGRSFPTEWEGGSPLTRSWGTGGQQLSTPEGWAPINLEGHGGGSGATRQAQGTLGLTGRGFGQRGGWGGCAPPNPTVTLRKPPGASTLPMWVPLYRGKERSEAEEDGGEKRRMGQRERVAAHTRYQQPLHADTGKSAHPQHFARGGHPGSHPQNSAPLPPPLLSVLPPEGEKANRACTPQVLYPGVVSSDLGPTAPPGFAHDARTKVPIGQAPPLSDSPGGTGGVGVARLVPCLDAPPQHNTPPGPEKLGDDRSARPGQHYPCGGRVQECEKNTQTGDRTDTGTERPGGDGSAGPGPCNTSEEGGQGCERSVSTGAPLSTAAGAPRGGGLWKQGPSFRGGAGATAATISLRRSTGGPR